MSATSGRFKGCQRKIRRHGRGYDWYLIEDVSHECLARGWQRDYRVAAQMARRAALERGR